MSVTAIALALPWAIVALSVALGAWVGFQLILQNGRLLGRLEAIERRLEQLSMLPAAAPLPAPEPMPPTLPAGLPLGSPAPAFALPDLNGARKALADFHGQKLLLLFFNPGCGFCTRMAPDLAALPVDSRDGLPIPLVISTGEPEENRELVAEHRLRGPVLLQEAMEVASQYQCHGTPMGYLLDEEGRIASELAVGAEALLALARGPESGADGHGPIETNGHRAGALGGTRTLAESKLQRNGLPAGTPAPSFTLPRLDGGDLSLADFRGRQVLLVFSDPKCGPCDALAPQLERTYRASPAVQVLMVSRGEGEANRAKVAEHGLTFPIALQRQWEVSREYAMFATPVAYWIDEAGIIAAEAAVGVEPILALLASAAGTNGPARPRRCPCGRSEGRCDCGRNAPVAAGGRRAASAGRIGMRKR
jgi:peroxiredoxin